MRKYRLEAFDEAGIKLFERLVPNIKEACKAVLNHGMAGKVSWVKYRLKRLQMWELYKLANKDYQPKHMRGIE